MEQVSSQHRVTNTLGGRIVSVTAALRILQLKCQKQPTTDRWVLREERSVCGSVRVRFQRWRSTQLALRRWTLRHSLWQWNDADFGCVISARISATVRDNVAFTCASEKIFLPLMVQESVLRFFPLFSGRYVFIACTRIFHFEYAFTINSSKVLQVLWVLACVCCISPNFPYCCGAPPST